MTAQTPKKTVARKATTAKGRATQAKTAAAASTPAKHTGLITELKPAAKEINTRFQRAAVADGKADDHRLAAAIKLAEVKAKCEAQKMPFKKWFDENITEQSYENARKLVVIGEAKDPEAALADMRSKNKTANKKARDKKKAGDEGSRDTSTPSKSLTPMERVEQGLAPLDDTAKVNVLDSEARKLGMQVLSLAQASKLAKDAKVNKLDLTGLKQAFGELKASEQMEFVNYAADAVGATVEMPFVEPKSEEEVQADLADIPPALKAKAPAKGKRQRTKQAA
jgi:hypothetical protein